MENEFVAKFFQDIEDDVLLQLFHETSIGICKIVIKGIYVNFIYWSKCDNFCLGFETTWNNKSIMTQW